MRILGLDAAMARCSAALLVDGVVRGEREAPGGRGQQTVLAQMVAELLDGVEALDAVAVSIGPGSFTGLRSAIALAHVLAAGRCKVLGVTVDQALSHQLGNVPGRAIWTAIDSRRGRIFLTRHHEATIAINVVDVAPPAHPVVVAGDAAPDLVAWLTERGADAWLSDVRQPAAASVAQVAARMLAGDLPPHEAQPLYVDPPEAKLPAGGLRPAPLA